MPNWCENSLSLFGEYEILMNFFKENKTDNSELSFEKLVPFPDGNYDRDFAVSEWGTKWEPSNIYLIFTPEELESLNEETRNNFKIEYSFDTAWGPPINWLEKVSKKYKNIIFEIEYAEGGCDFAGIQIYKQGELTHEVDYSFSEYKLIKNGPYISEYIINELESKEKFPKITNLIDFKNYLECENNDLSYWYIEDVDDYQALNKNLKILYEIYENNRYKFEYYDSQGTVKIILSLIDDIINKRLNQNKKLINDHCLKYIPNFINNDIKELIIDNMINLF